MIKDVYEEGYEAGLDYYYNGKVKKVNPYHKRTTQYVSWKKGFRDCKTDLLKRAFSSIFL